MNNQLELLLPPALYRAFTMTDNLKVCEHHEDSPIFRWHRETLVEGKILSDEFEFCRYCVEAHRVTCPNEDCDNEMRVIDMDSERLILADESIANLKCTKCGEILASAEI